MSDEQDHMKAKIDDLPKLGEKSVFDYPQSEKTKLELRPVPEGREKATAKVSTSLGFFELIYQWVYYNLFRELKYSMEIVMGEQKEVAVQPKAWYTSKMFWLNIIGALWMIFAEPLGLPSLDAEVEGIILAALNVLLRLITKQPVSIR